MTITDSDLVGEIRRLAGENPDYVYPDAYCRYVKEGEGSCLVGQALINLGVPVNWFLDHSSDYNDLRNAGTFSEIRDLVPGLKVSDLVTDWVDTAQSSQDDQTPWAEAVEGADQCYPEVA